MAGRAISAFAATDSALVPNAHRIVDAHEVDHQGRCEGLASASEQSKSAPNGATGKRAEQQQLQRGYCPTLRPLQ